MAKLTKSAAYETAKAMANAALNPKIELLQQKRRDLLVPYALKSIPDFVLKLYTDNSELQPYFNTRKSFQYCCEELHEDYSSYDLDVYIPKHDTSSNYLHVSKSDYEELISIKNEISLLMSKKHQLFAKIEATLLSLGTFKRIQKDFPEAFAAIPVKYTEQSTETTIALPLDELKEELLKYK